MIPNKTQMSYNVLIPWGRGYGRFNYKENIQFCRQARDSLFELLDYLTVAFDEGYIKDKYFGEYREKIFEIIRMLNSYIKYLNRRKIKMIKYIYYILFYNLTIQPLNYLTIAYGNRSSHLDKNSLFFMYIINNLER